MDRLLCKLARTEARYTLTTKLKSTRSTSLKVDKVDRVALAPYTLATKVHTGNKGTHWQQRYTLATKVHTGNKGTHWRQRYTLATKVHTGNKGTHWQQRYTLATKVHTGDKGTHWQQRYTLATKSKGRATFGRQSRCIGHVVT